MVEINTLADTLRVQRLGAHEATALLRSVMAKIDVAIFAFDESHHELNNSLAPIKRLPVEVTPGPDTIVHADADQLEQLLINLVRNAVDATLETGGRVTIDWTREDHTLEVFVEDEGPGVQNTGNLFVPFFTTKPGGSGIGLALSRQIAEGHDGAVTLSNRERGPGARASLRLPLADT